MIIYDIFSASIPTYLLFSQVRKPILDTVQGSHGAQGVLYSRHMVYPHAGMGSEFEEGGLSRCDQQAGHPAEDGNNSSHGSNVIHCNPCSTCQHISTSTDDAQGMPPGSSEDCLPAWFQSTVPHLLGASKKIY